MTVPRLAAATAAASIAALSASVAGFEAVADILFLTIGVSITILLMARLHRGA
jgi:hypothetical protein